MQRSPDNKSVHTESRVARIFEINVVRRDPVTSTVRRHKIWSVRLTTQTF